MVQNSVTYFMDGPFLISLQHNEMKLKDVISCWHLVTQYIGTLYVWQVYFTDELTCLCEMTTSQTPQA